ncbi:acetyl esterase/lipase [Rathayibacter sp. PhB127]|uniref:alpha/beta hydrolase n=1 Tax=Rathayibacter sp. PhB127 TaxID=2485176 RepID=UPI000FB05ADD|nr:alpha/beta hydrolase [Rathayibacter sp. PhB127]ROS28679.1 acetyl esterase/lipase [Rathayibacter sp. PhB127]
MDAELAAATELMLRPDLNDVEGTRRLMGSSTMQPSSAEMVFGGSVAIESRSVRLDGHDIGLRLYRPSASVGSALLFLHGGAFVAGDTLSENARCLRYAGDAGCLVVSVDYRLAPEHAYPHGLRDCRAVLRWMIERAAELGIDPARIAVAGVSAGGALAAGVSMLALDEGERVPRAQLLLFPVLDDRLHSTSMREFDATPVWDNRNAAVMWRLYLAGAPADEYAAPARRESLLGLPETYLLAAELDPLRDEALRFGARLLEDRVPVDLRLWAGTYHVFDQLVPDAAVSQASLEDQVRFLRRTLRP